HRLAELDALVREAYLAFDYKRIFAALNAFMTVDLSAFYFDVRKDALYCDPVSSVTRKACLTVLDHLFRCTVLWLAPMLCFTAEEAWLARYASAESVHLELFPEVPAAWRDDELAEKWRKVRLVRRVVTGALEIERAAKRIGSSLEAAPVIYVADRDLLAALAGIDMAEVAITSGASVVEGEGPPDDAKRTRAGWGEPHPRLVVSIARPVRPAGPRGGADRRRARPGLQAVAALRLRPRRAGAGGARAGGGPGAGAQLRHLLRLVP